MSKRARENKLRERRVEKQAKKAARKLASAEQRDAGGADPAGTSVAPAEPGDRGEIPGL